MGKDVRKEVGFVLRPDALLNTNVRHVVIYDNVEIRNQIHEKIRHIDRILVHVFLTVVFIFRNLKNDNENVNFLRQRRVDYANMVEHVNVKV